MNYLVFALTDNYNLVSDLLAITNPIPSFILLIQMDFAYVRKVHEVKIRIFKLHQGNSPSKVLPMAQMKMLAYQVLLKTREEVACLYVSPQIGVALGLMQEAL